MFGFQFGWGKLDFAESVAAAKSADAVVLCMGYEYMSEGEGFERTFTLPSGQSELIQAVAAANPRTVVMTTGGGAYQTAEWLPKVPALLQLWYLGQNGGTAAGEILFGKVNPSGKLPATFDARWEDNPSSPYFKADWSKPSPYPVEYTEGLLMGYRGYDAAGRAPLFPFGHGLSYTTFKYSDLALSKTKEGDFKISLKVRNTGNRPGAEVVQLYVGQQSPAVQRPVRELKGFDRAQLQPGEQTELTLNVRLQDLKVFDSATRSWTLPQGDYEFSVGSSSRDLHLKAISSVK
jgi:beta-glucosidase